LCHINDISNNVKHYTRDTSRSVLLCSLFCLWLGKTRWNLIPDLLLFSYEHSACLPLRHLEASLSFIYISCNTTNVILKDLCIKQAVLTSFVSFSWICHSFVFVNPHSTRCGVPASPRTTRVQTSASECILRSKSNFLFSQVLKMNKFWVTQVLQLEEISCSIIFPRAEQEG